MTRGNNFHRQCDVPEAKVGARHMQVAAGSHHTVLLLSDGQVVACGYNDFGQCNVPEAAWGPKGRCIDMVVQVWLVGPCLRLGPLARAQRPGP